MPCDTKVATALVRQSSTGCVAFAPAKLNLSLRVLRKRVDGFHDIDSIVAPLLFGDMVVVRPREREGVELVLVDAFVRAPRRAGDDADGRSVPAGPENLVCRAMAELLREIERPLQATVTLVKRVPPQSGLGGGSGDAAATLHAANRAFDLGVSFARLREVAARLGSDIPALLYPGPTRCRGRGEVVTPLCGLPSLHVVIARPHAGAATPEVYRRCQPSGRPLEVELLASWRAGNIASLRQWMHNDLTQPAIAACPAIAESLATADKIGLKGAAMTGSGSAIFGLVASAAEARRAAARLRARGFPFAIATRTRPALKR